MMPGSIEGFGEWNNKLRELTGDPLRAAEPLAGTLRNHQLASQFPKLNYTE